MRFFIFCFLLLFSFQTSFSQYTLDWKKEPIQFGVGSGLAGAGFLFLNDFDIPSDDELRNLHLTPPDFKFKPDKWAIKQSSDGARITSDILLFTSVIPPALLFLDRPKENDDRQTQLIMTTETLVLTWGLTSFSKRAFKRKRPYMYNNDLLKFPMECRRSKNAQQSFFSGHTSGSAALYFFTAATYSKYYPDSKFKPWVWGASVSIPALTGFMRIKAGKHFPTDVIVGYAVGALIGGVLVPKLH